MSESEMSDAAIRGDIDTVRRLLALGRDPARRALDGPLPLHGAAIGGEVETVRLLLDAGAPVDARDSDGSSALMKAALWGHADVVAELLARGADPLLEDADRWTALSLATQLERGEVIPLLMAARDRAHAGTRGRAPPAPAALPPSPLTSPAGSPRRSATTLHREDHHA